MIISENIEAEPDVFLYNCKKHGRSVGPTTVLLQAMDNVQSRMCTIMYWKLCDIFDKYPYSIYDQGTMGMVLTEISGADHVKKPLEENGYFEGI